MLYQQQQKTFQHTNNVLKFYIHYSVNRLNNCQKSKIIQNTFSSPNGIKLEEILETNLKTTKCLKTKQYTCK